MRVQSGPTVEAWRVRDDAVAGLNCGWSVLWATTLDANMQSLMSGGRGKYGPSGFVVGLSGIG